MESPFKKYCDELYDHYYSKFTHRDPQKKQWYAIQMVTNIIEKEKAEIEKEKIEIWSKNKSRIPDIF